jgi:hypothetical protein
VELHLAIFAGTNENAVKSQIYIALTILLLLEFTKRVIPKKIPAFTTFVEKPEAFVSNSHLKTGK